METVENKKTESKKILSDKENQKILSASIMLAIDCDSAFKMHSYRCISQEQFVERIMTLVAFYTETLEDYDKLNDDE